MYKWFFIFTFAMKKQSSKHIFKMKKLLFLLSLVAIGFVSNAQINQRITLKQATGAVSDTITDAGTAYLETTLSGAPSTVGVEVIVQKVSGTVAGTATLSGKLGTNYYTIGTAATLTNTAGSKGYAFIVDGGSAPYTAYRVTFAGGTTCVYYVTGVLISKK